MRKSKMIGTYGDSISTSVKLLFKIVDKFEVIYVFFFSSLSTKKRKEIVISNFTNKTFGLNL